MKNKKKIIVIIPARGGSKGIPRKNIRLLADKPLISYSIETALRSKYIDDVVVSTEDDEIAEISKMYGAQVVKRPEALSRDETPLDPVIVQAVKTMEKKKNIKYDLVITIQPTSPLLTLKTLNKAIEMMLKGNHDTLMPVKDETHLYWTQKDKKFIPLYKERVNRQYLDPIYQESGTPLIAKREVMDSGTRIGKKIFLFEVPKEEGIDIDNSQDWWIVENLLKRMKIVFRVDADKKMGMGHVYRVLTLADRLRLNHEIYFLVRERGYLGIEKLQEHHHKIISFKDDKDFFKKIKEIDPRIVINDILDTEKKYIEELKKRGYFVVNFEDLGLGSEIADVVINAIYESSSPPKNHYCGYKYVCLRDEFSIVPPKIETNKKVKNILITFGGTDPNNITLSALKAVEKLKLKSVLINVVLGLGYGCKEELYDYVAGLRKRGFTIDVKENTKMMAKEIHNADLAVTSNGITIYEIASIGTPCISISQNEREARHIFVQNSRCIKYLGMAYNVSTQDIAEAVKKMIENYELRKEMQRRLLKFNLKKGVDKVLRLIFDKYYENPTNYELKRITNKPANYKLKRITNY